MNPKQMTDEDLFKSFLMAFVPPNTEIPLLWIIDNEKVLKEIKQEILARMKKD